MTGGIKIGMLGAGPVNFGGQAGVPWNHAARIEQLAGRFPLEVVGICDQRGDLAQARLAARREVAPELYRHCETFAEWPRLAEHVATCAQEAGGQAAIFVGLPPGAHGTPEPPGDVELGCTRQGIHLFVEKPLSAGDLAPVQAVRDELAAIRRQHRAAQGRALIVGVGYMLRYQAGVAHLHQRLAQEAQAGRPARLFTARYCCTYPDITTAFWSLSRSGGPIVEQATHFIDLARHLMGEIDVSSIRALDIAPREPAGSACPDAPQRPRSGVGRRPAPGRPHPPQHGRVVALPVRGPRLTAARHPDAGGRVRRRA